MANLVFSDKHNMVALLDTSSSNARPFRQVINFLSNCDITTAITANPDIYEDQIREFWETAEVAYIRGAKTIVATVAGQSLEVNIPVLRHILELPDSGNTTYTDEELRTVFRRMGCEGDVLNLRLVKKFVSYQWRFLWHVVIHCLASRKAGWDTLNLQLASGIAALCQGRPFDWGLMIFDNLVNNITAAAKYKFLVYPRFIQMIITARLSNVPNTGDRLQLHQMTDLVWNLMKAERAQSGFSGRYTPLFPYMIERGQAEESETSGDESSDSDNDDDNNDGQAEAPRPEPEQERQEVQHPTHTRRKSIAKRPRPAQIPSRSQSPKRRREVRSKNVHDPSASTEEGPIVRELKGLRAYVIGLGRDLAELKRNSSAQTAALIEQTVILKKQNATLKSQMKKLRKEVARLSKKDKATSTEDSETSDDSDDDSSGDDSSDDNGSDDDADDADNDQNQAAEPQPSDSESDQERQQGSSTDSEATESQQSSEGQSEARDEEIEMPEATEMPETETTMSAEPESLTDVQILDAQSNIAGFTVRQLKDYLKRHGWTSARLNKTTIDIMRSEAAKIQLDLIQLLPEGTATAVERDLISSASIAGLERTLHPRKLPQPSKHRIVHWKFDADKDCYMVKRITGDTQFFYSTYDLTKLTEEDLIELTNLNLQNDRHNSRAYAFEKFLKKIKRENFESISKNKKIMKPKTREYLKDLGMTKEKMLEEQFLAIKPDQVPTQSAQNMLDNFTRWYLNDKSFEMVIEREEEEEIRVFHAAELNQFNLNDLEILASNPPEGKKEWNKDLIEFMWKTAIRLYRRYESAKPSTTKTTAPAPPTD